MSNGILNLKTIKNTPFYALLCLLCISFLLSCVGTGKEDSKTSETKTKEGSTTTSSSLWQDLTEGTLTTPLVTLTQSGSDKEDNTPTTESTQATSKVPGTTTPESSATDSKKEPIIPTVPEKDTTQEKEWVVYCNEFISLRKEPSFDSDNVVTLKKGAKVTLLHFEQRFAYVRYDKKNSAGKVTKSYYGYAVAAYIVLPESNSYEEELKYVTPVNKYSYEQMQEDLLEMAEAYPQRLSLSSIGKSEEGRDLTLALLGNQNAKNHIFVSASIHAREYMTTVLVMAQIDYMLAHENYLYKDSQKTISDVLDTTCFHILTMANPDGVYISQSGILPEMFKGQYTSYQISNWKANAKGIDLNANFDGGWYEHGDNEVAKPCDQNYKGEYPECAAESKAIANYIRSRSFDVTLSYHTTGSIIYYSYGDNQEVIDKSYSLAKEIEAVSGYTPQTQAASSSAGLKDWAMDKLEIPSLTIEFASFNNPIMLQEFSNIWARGRDTLIISGLWLEDNNA